VSKKKDDYEEHRVSSCWFVPVVEGNKVISIGCNEESRDITPASSHTTNEEEGTLRDKQRGISIHVCVLNGV
jgi:hypothetical protein